MGLDKLRTSNLDGCLLLGLTYSQTHPITYHHHQHGEGIGPGGEVALCRLSAFLSGKLGRKKPWI